jgi:murein DD-endopeptidase MepM/ murein hydrolase activator NlpD
LNYHLDIPNKFTTEYQDDNSMYYGTEKVIQTGSDGLNRVTEQVQYKNGAIEQLVITRTSSITPTVNQIVARGTKTYSSGNYTYINTGNDDWYWPTVSPYIITSYFAYRWGSLHRGIDISGSGFGSPIRSATDGTVIETYSSCSNYGSLYNQCGGSYGNNIKVSILGGQYTVIYAHLTNNLKVSVGDTITRGQIIGYMGDSGSSTGTHLHFQINNASGEALNPCKVAFSC